VCMCGCGCGCGCVCVCVCARVPVHACACVRACARAFMHVCVSRIQSELLHLLEFGCMQVHRDGVVLFSIVSLCMPSVNSFEFICE
jgi:hypothetical protein